MTTDRSADVVGDTAGAAPADALALLAAGNRRTPRVARLRLGIGAAIMLLLAVLVIAVVVSMLASHGSTTKVPPVSAQTARGADPTAEPTAADSAPAVLFVHVLGAVHSPGLYELHAGSRVIDAVSAAGGLAAEADQAGVNLARVLSDGEQLVVPTIGQTLPPGSASGPAAGVTGPGSTQGAKVDLNTATEPELETLPRVGPAMAQRILAWRSANGRFTSVDDLLDITGIGDKTFEALKDLVTV